MSDFDKILHCGVDLASRPYVKIDISNKILAIKQQIFMAQTSQFTTQLRPTAKS